MREYLINRVIRMGDAFSQLWNTWIYLSDNPNESTSGRSYTDGFIGGNWFFLGHYYAINFIASLLGEEDHCRKAYLSDLERARKTVAGAE